MSDKNNTNSSAVRKFYSVTEFHELIGEAVSKVQVYRMIRRGEIPAKYLGEKILIPAVWVDNFMDMSNCSNSSVAQ